MFELILFAAAAASGAIASVVGFGIGSVLTPLLAVRIPTQLAVAAVSIPHFFATALRFWRFARPCRPAGSHQLWNPQRARGTFRRVVALGRWQSRAIYSIRRDPRVRR